VDDIVVGANDNAVGGMGAVYIHFMNTDGSIDSTATITNGTANTSSIAAEDHYGYAVESLGDLDGDGVVDIAVGAFANNGGGIDRGSVHIHFLNTNGSVKSTVEINDTTTNGPVLANSDYYGSSIANMGDLNSDGVIDIAVGAYADDAGGGNRGTVHIHYMNTDGSIDSTVEINDLTANGPVLANSDFYGFALINMGDLDGDGINDIAVGGSGDDGAGSDRGAVYISYLNSNGSVKSTVEINDTTTNGPVLANSDYYGSSIANMGDLDGDGIVDIAVGAYADDAGGGNRGTVHISYLNSNGSVKSTVEINDTTTTGPVLSNTDNYGISVANIGDLNGDGITDIAVGAWLDDAGGTDRGAVHIHFLDELTYTFSGNVYTDQGVTPIAD
jgi:hypothetical protein